MYPLNINTIVRVKLTDFGNEVLRHHNYKWGIEENNHKLDAEGYYKAQLWELINIFGPECYNGNPKTFFEGNNIFIDATE